MSVQVVWFKRDLRVSDHRPLAAAAVEGPVLPLYVFEPGYWRQPDTALRHWAFLRESLLELDAELSALGAGLHVMSGVLPRVLGLLHERYGVAALHAHEETGNDWTYRRDRAVAAWCRDHGVAWREQPQFGVVRPLPSRDRWTACWEARMAEPLRSPPAVLQAAASPPVAAADALPPVAGADRRPCPARQPGGRRAALESLDSFLDARGEHYRRAMASPLAGEQACSRLSPYLACGALSLREVVGRHRARWREARAASGASHWARSLKSFESRLHWHCHFMQKLEDQPDIEFRNLHRGYDGMREDSFDEALFEAWSEGRTGWPLVDACIRMLHHTGWLNFRMRAMLVSVSSYHLWLHWRRPALHLARLFTDYEPGIHYCQVQMQSGTTGINAIRIYNPLKQSRDQDPGGEFIRRWVPELANVPAPWVHQPWHMSATMQARAGVRVGRDYPAPVLDHQRAARAAREAIRAHRASRDMAAEAAAIRRRHASRAPAPGRSRAARRRPSDRRQLDFDW